MTLRGLGYLLRKTPMSSLRQPALPRRSRCARCLLLGILLPVALFIVINTSACTARRWPRSTRPTTAPCWRRPSPSASSST